jgi:hypothetical protein
LKTLVAVVTLIQFFAASALGSSVISWREMNCSQPEKPLVQGCCARPMACEVEKPKPCQDKTRVVWTIRLSLDPSIVPCCAHVSPAPELTDFSERQRPFDHSPDIVMTEPALVNAVIQSSNSVSSHSRPQGVHPIISTTVLRC